MDSTQLSPEQYLLSGQIQDSFFEPFKDNKWFQQAQESGLDPFLGAVAASPNKLQHQSYASLMSILGRQIADSYRPNSEDEQQRKLVDDTQDALRNGANVALSPRSRRAEFVAASVGAAAAGYGFDRLLLDSVDSAYESLGGNTKLQSDPSILPGRIGVFDIAGYQIAIPGFKDVPKHRRELVSYDITNKETSVDLVEATIAYERGENDPALDLELTGNEYIQDLEVATTLIKEIASKGEEQKLLLVKVFGVASDELFGEQGVDGLGELDKENMQLAEERAAVGAVAFEDAAKAQGLEVPEIELASYEDLLTNAEIQQINDLAEKLGVSRIDMIKSFNRNSKDIPEDIVAELEILLPRGVSYSIEYQTTTTSTETVQEIKEVKNESITAGLPSEALALPTMAIAAGVSTLLLANRIQNFLNKRAARKEIKAAVSVKSK